MSLGKLPVLSWVSGSHGKRRLRSELTADMISPPLGDFRHTMHVGRGGDVFGDTSFLSNHGGAETTKADNFFTRTLRHVRRTPLKRRGSGGQAEASPAPPAISPIIKNAVSLPQLNEGMYDGGGGRGLTSKFSFKSASNSFSKTHQAYAPHSWQPVWSSSKGVPPNYPQPYTFTMSSFPEEAKRVLGQWTNAHFQGYKVKETHGTAFPISTQIL